MPSVIAAGTTSNTALNFTADTTGVLQLQTNGTTAALTIDTSQNVGIGTASPTAKLYINANNATATQILQDETNGAKLRCITNSINVDFGNSGGGGYLAVSGAWPLTFSTNSSERMRIDSVGRVGIGNSSPSALLHVTNNSNTYAGGILIGSAGVASGYISTTDNLYIKPNTTANTASGVVVIQDFSNANKIMLSSVNGTIGLGGANAASTGVGITFPATQSASSDANTLDDYEEGTWTATITAGSGSVTSYTSATNTYTKIGRTVIVVGRITLTNVGTASGQMIVGSLPFTSLNQTALTAGTTRESASTGNIYFNVMSPNVTTFNVQNSTNGGIVWTNNYIYDFTLVYQTST